MSPRAGLDRETVIQAAAQMVNEEGVDALTLGHLANRLGVQTPSLYNHIGGLPDLRRELAVLNAYALGQAMADAAIGKSGPQALNAVAQAYRGYIKTNPGLYLATLRSSGLQSQPDPALTTAEKRAVDTVLAVLASFGLSGEDALHAARALRSAVHGFTTLEISGGFGIPLDLDESFRRLIETLAESLSARKGGDRENP